MAESKRIFTYEQALDTFPAVRDVTTSAVRQVQALYSRVQSPEELEQRGDELEGAAHSIIESWVAEMARLDCGDGYYCWRYPEEALGFFHGYEDGYQGRVPIA